MRCPEVRVRRHASLVGESEALDLWAVSPLISLAATRQSVFAFIKVTQERESFPHLSFDTRFPGPERKLGHGYHRGSLELQKLQERRQSNRNRPQLSLTHPICR